MGSGNYTDVFGGKTEGTGTPETDQNQSRDNNVTVTGGTITNALYGGYTSIGTGSAIRNTVTITGGNVHGVYGGFMTPGTGKTTHNTVNLGDGKNPMAAGYSLGRIYGGSHAADVTGNTLNVKVCSLAFPAGHRKLVKHHVLNADRIPQRIRSSKAHKEPLLTYMLAPGRF